MAPLGQFLLCCLGKKNFTTVMEGGNGRRFAFRDIKKATDNFSEQRVIGRGGFGKVYKGELRDGTIVAVKRSDPESQQGLNEFRTEVILFSSLRHNHMVSLIGYCDEKNEMILVYEFMDNGTLRSHLYGSRNHPVLSWEKRLDICIGAAMGLHYLHTDPENGIIHRDIKSTNILLDNNFCAKVSDFGLAKIGPEPEKGHVSTRVKGSFGYFDPEYATWQQLTKKSDVYSFGVVLFEVLTGRPAVDETLSPERVSLSQWVMDMLKKGQLEEIVDRKISGTIKRASLDMFVDVAKSCLAKHGMERPSMENVIRGLTNALDLQVENSATSSRIHQLVAMDVGTLESISETRVEPGVN